MPPSPVFSLEIDQAQHGVSLFYQGLDGISPLFSRLQVLFGLQSRIRILLFAVALLGFKPERLSVAKIDGQLFQRSV